MKKSNSIYILSAGAGLAVATYLTITPEIGRGEFLHGMLCIYGGIIAFVAYIVSRAFAHFKTSQTAARIFAGVAIFSLISSLSIFSGNMILENDIRKAKEFCETVAPLLEAYQQKNGAYPPTISKVFPNGINNLPSSLQDHFQYTIEGDSFTLSFADPGGMMNGWLYSGKDHKWHRWD